MPMAPYRFLKTETKLNGKLYRKPLPVAANFLFFKDSSRIEPGGHQRDQIQRHGTGYQ